MKSSIKKKSKTQKRICSSISGEETKPKIQLLCPNPRSIASNRTSFSIIAIKMRISFRKTI
jgi:hypothetical protein